jgi:hypothetical protein
MPFWLPKRLHRFATKLLLWGDSRRALPFTVNSAQTASRGPAQPSTAAGKSILTQIRREYRPRRDH